MKCVTSTALAPFEQTLFIGIFNWNRCEPIKHLNSNGLFRAAANAANVQVCAFYDTLGKNTRFRLDVDFQARLLALQARTASTQRGERAPSVFPLERE